MLLVIDSLPAKIDNTTNKIKSVKISLSKKSITQSPQRKYPQSTGIFSSCLRSHPNPPIPNAEIFENFYIPISWRAPLSRMGKSIRAHGACTRYGEPALVIFQKAFEHQVHNLPNTYKPTITIIITAAGFGLFPDS